MNPINWKNFGTCLAISTGMLCFAYPGSVIGVTLGQPSFLEYMDLLNEDKTAISSHGNTLISLFTGIFQAGAVFGIVVAGKVMEKWGPRVAMRFCAIVSIISGAILAASQGPTMFIVFRFFAGFSSWGFLPLTPVYCTELAPPEHRGLLAGINGVLVGLGFSIASYVGLGFFYVSSPIAQWRAPLALGIVFPILVLVILCFTPESPRFLLLTDRPDEAWKVVANLHAVKGDPRSEHARAEFFQIQQQITLDKEMNASWMEMFMRPSYRKRLLLGVAFAFFGQSTGVGVITQYSTIIYRGLGFGTRDQIILSCGFISVSIFGNLGGALCADRFGRKALMLWAFLGCLACLTVEIIMVALYAAEATNKSGLSAAAAFTFVILVFYTAGVDAVCPIFFTEIYPNHIRAKGATTCYMIFALTNLVYAQAAPKAFQNIGWRFYLVFIVIMVIATAWTWFFVPETKGLPLEEIGALFGDTDDIVVYLKDVHVDRTNEEIVVDSHPKVDHMQVERVN